MDNVYEGITFNKYTSATTHKNVDEETAAYVKHFFICVGRHEYTMKIVLMQDS